MPPTPARSWSRDTARRHAGAVLLLVVAVGTLALAPAPLAALQDTTASRDGGQGASIPAMPPGATVLHVDADSDVPVTGWAGSADRPYPHIAWAVAHAQFLRERGHAVRIVVAPGTYRETIHIVGVGDNPPLVVESQVPGQAVVSGAEIESRWTRTGEGGHFVAPWEHDWGLAPIPPGWGGVEVPDGVRRREAVLVDGAPLRQVLEQDELVPGTFLVDESADRLVVDPPAGVDDLGDHLVEVAERDRVLRIRRRAENVTVKGFVFEAAAATLQKPMGQVVNARDVLLEANTFRHSSWDGLSVCCTGGVTVRDNRLVDNGGTGLGTDRVRDALVEGNTMTGNNVRGADHGYAGWSVAGSKNLRLHDAVYRGNTYDDNWARGLWFDTDVTNVLVDGDRSCGNLLSGAFIEKVQGPLTIRDSTFCRNPHGGIVVATSGNVTIERSTLEDNGHSQLVFSGGRFRVWTDHVTGEVVTMGDFENWTLRDNEIVSPGAARLIHSPVIPIEHWRHLLASGEMTANGNTWTRASYTDAIRLKGENFPMQEWYATTGDTAGP